MSEQRLKVPVDELNTFFEGLRECPVVSNTMRENLMSLFSSPDRNEPMMRAIDTHLDMSEVVGADTPAPAGPVDVKKTRVSRENVRAMMRQLAPVILRLFPELSVDYVINALFSDAKSMQVLNLFMDITE